MAHFDGPTSIDTYANERLALRVMRIFGGGSWVRFEDEQGVPGTLYLRYQDGQIRELHLVAGERSITAADLRRLPLGRLGLMAAGRVDVFHMTNEWMPDPEVLRHL